MKPISYCGAEKQREWRGKGVCTRMWKVVPQGRKGRLYWDACVYCSCCPGWYRDRGHEWSQRREFFFFFFFKFLLEYSWLTMLWEFQVHSKGAQPCVSMHPFYPTPALPSRLPHHTEQSSLRRTVGPCWVSILNIVVRTCQFQTPKLPLPAILLQGNHKFIL